MGAIRELEQWGERMVPVSEWTSTVPADKRGRVVRVDRGECDVITRVGRVRVLSDSQRAQGEVAPVTGDWVELADPEGLGTVIERVLPRRTTVSRRDPAERDVRQVLASNVDVVAAVLGLDRPIQPGWLERLLVMGLDSGAEALVVLTKADETSDHRDALVVIEAIASTVLVTITGTVDGRGLAELRSRVGAGRTLALVGESGAGKSSLVNALAGDDILEVGAVRPGDAEGRHTTTARELVLLPDDDGLVLDTPGIRTLGLWEAETALDLVFGDLLARAEECRFRDCAHRHEPGCAILESVEHGSISAMRLRLFTELVEELAALRRREEERGRRTGRRPRNRRR